MANIYEPTDEQERTYQEWLGSRPTHVRAVASKFRPWKLYRLGKHRVTVYSFGEKHDGTITLTVNVRAEYNLVVFERSVFGVNPDDLVECDLPGSDEPVGTLFSQDEVQENLPIIRDMMGVKKMEES